MRQEVERALRARFRSQHGLISRGQRRALGASAGDEKARVASGQWELVRPNVIGLVGVPSTAQRRLTAAVLGAGPSAIASHRSAAWLWGLLPEPGRHSVTVGRRVTVRDRAIEIHWTDHPAARSFVANIPCTNPLRTLVDLAAVATETELDRAVDRAIAQKLLTVAAIEAEIARVARPGRSGVGKMRAALQRRGLVGAPHPSVLESRLMRLLHAAGIAPVGVEVVMYPDGRYRVDVMLTERVVLEGAGYTYHWSPEAMAADERRRNQLALDGLFVLFYTWVDITFDGGRVLAEATRAIEANPAGARTATAGGRMATAGGRGTLARWP